MHLAAPHLDVHRLPPASLLLPAGSERSNLLLEFLSWFRCNRLFVILHVFGAVRYPGGDQQSLDSQHYADTMQERAIELFGKKLSASLAIEGKLTDDGLASMCAGEDMTLVLAKALVQGTHIQGAESVWRALNQPRQMPKQANVIPFLRKKWSLELLEERSGMLWDHLDIPAFG